LTSVTHLNRFGEDFFFSQHSHKLFATHYGYLKHSSCCSIKVGRCLEDASTWTSCRWSACDYFFHLLCFM